MFAPATEPWRGPTDWSRPLISAFLYLIVGVCGLVLIAVNLNPVSLLAGLAMAVVGLAAAFRQYRRVKAARAGAPD